MQWAQAVPIPRSYTQPGYFWPLRLGDMSVAAPMTLAQPLVYPPKPQQASALSWGAPLGQRLYFILRILTSQSLR